MKVIEKIAEKQVNIWDKDGVTIAVWVIVLRRVVLNVI